jgi:GPH family glycoside/pentoside/hexuronide:cation symporter
MLAYTAINVPYSALLAVLSPVAEERIKATQYRFVFASIGTLSVGALATPLVSSFGGDDELLGFRLTILLFAVLSVLLFGITFATTRERVRPVMQATSIRHDLKQLLKNASWIALVAAGIFIVVGLIIRFASIVYYMRYYALDDGVKVFLFMDRTALVTSCGLVGQLFGALLTPYLAARFEKSHLVAGMSLAHVVLLALCFFLTADQFGVLVLLHTAGIFTFGVIITLLFSMYTDCAEYGRYHYGTNSAGLVVSASMFSLKFGSALGGALPGFALAAFGFVANEAQTEATLLGIRAIFCFLPALFFFVGACAIMFYRIDRETLKVIEGERNAQTASALSNGE